MLAKSCTETVTGALPHVLALVWMDGACALVAQITSVDDRCAAVPGETARRATAATASRNRPTWRVCCFLISKAARPLRTGCEAYLADEMALLRDRIHPALY